MDRRNFLLGVVVGGAVLATSGTVWLGSRSNSSSLTIDACLQSLDDLMNENIMTLGDWNLAHILVHCAQSVEFSMSEYPDHKPALFKNTVGKLAYAAFSAKGEMIHGLNEHIPGAPLIEESEDTANAYRRFRESMIRFRYYTGPLAQHFAYGKLTKLEYERAHAMHFYNHLLEVDFTSQGRKA